MPSSLPHNTLVLVADGRKMLLLRNHGDSGRIDLQADAHEERHDHKDSDMKSDMAGQSHSPAGSGLPGGTMGETDYHQQAEDRFAAHVADKMKTMVLNHEVDDLVVIAPPKTLGELRHHWHKEVQSRILFELNKEMTDHPIADITALIESHRADAN
jgi:protein required for attachment to host cells